MPAPTNQTPATALPMSLDYAYTLPDVDLATPNNCDVWWSYTAQAGDVVVGFWAYDVGLVASYTPTTTVWTGPIGSLTQKMDGNSATDVPCQFSVTPGEIYYLRVRNSSGMAPAAGTSVQISALRPPNLTATGPTGALLINDANNDGSLPATLIDSTTGAVLQFKNGIAAGEAGSVSPAGVFALDDADSEEIRVYSPLLATVAALSFPYYSDITLPYIAPSTSEVFYVSNGGDPPRNAEVATLNSDGTWTLITWDLGVVAVAAVCPNNAETILYFVRQGGGVGQIERYDLVNSLPLSDLAAAVPTNATYDICVLADDTILASYVDLSPNNFEVRRYSTAGALLNTYSFGAAGSITPPRMCLANDAGVSFWVMFLDSTDAANQFVQRIQVSDGTVLDNLDTVVFNRGVYQGTSAADNPRFGHSNSCPILPPRITITGTETPTPTPTPPGGGSGSFQNISPFRRRQRTFPHLSEEQIYAFHKALQIDMETGVGLGDPDDPEAYNPQAMLDWSDDGGHTWSNVHNKTLGKMGEYRHRVIYRMLGRSRDRIYRLTISDPVRCYVVGGIIDAEQGIS